ncbi:hypothetical protein B6N60_04111 [Richelia sinica FACHB-800]|uniref:Uncharacterized protein n=1 Tax=Richelia sinica FACHB-800 TaxID=1357546 RepID=A0A975Y6L1_9NOST|nr:hypothetical protein B6N60_04111 [Richelia sinica FACHB-800]
MLFLPATAENIFAVVLMREVRFDTDERLKFRTKNASLAPAIK